MRQPTELMREILTSERAQAIVDYISPLYGEDYVGLWLIEIIGAAIGGVENLCEDLQNQTNPCTATWALDYYEDEYGLPRNPALTIEQRRERILTRGRKRAPYNPARMCEAISAALNGVETVITENTAKNTFTVHLREAVDDITPAIDMIEEMKPAQLIYTILTTLLRQVQIQMYAGAGATQHKIYNVEVKY